LIVELAGRLDHSCCDLLAATLQQAIDTGVDRIVLDLSEVVAVDRAAVLAILLAHLRASDQRTQFLIVPGRRSVQEALEAIRGPFTYVDPENIESARQRRFDPDDDDG
jgi:anti-anti-sigma regulatory factor